MGKHKILRSNKEDIKLFQKEQKTALHQFKEKWGKKRKLNSYERGDGGNLAGFGQKFRQKNILTGG